MEMAAYVKRLQNVPEQNVPEQKKETKEELARNMEEVLTEYINITSKDTKKEIDKICRIGNTFFKRNNLPRKDV